MSDIRSDNDHKRTKADFSSKPPTKDQIEALTRSNRKWRGIAAMITAVSALAFVGIVLGPIFSDLLSDDFLAASSTGGNIPILLGLAVATLVSGFIAAGLRDEIQARQPIPANALGKEAARALCQAMLEDNQGKPIYPELHAYLKAVYQEGRDLYFFEVNSVMEHMASAPDPEDKQAIDQQRREAASQG